MLTLHVSKTGAVRAFSSYNMAQEWFSQNAFLIVRPDQFNDIVDHKGRAVPLVTTYDRMHTYKHGFPGAKPEPTPDDCWALAIEVADYVKRPPGGVDENPTTHAVLAKGFQVNLEHECPPSLPKQVKAISAALKARRFDFYTTEEMKAFMIEMVAERTLKTKQDPWRIFRYYRPMMIANNILIDHTGEN